MENDQIEIPALINRHVSRFIAVISIYSNEIKNKDDLQQVSEELLGSYLNKDIFDLSNEDKEEFILHQADKLFLNQLIEIYQKKKDDIEELLKANLIEKYSLHKLDRVIKAILSLTACELLYCGETPAKIIIDEYVSITKIFYGNSEAGFVNKVADLLARKTREEHEF